MSTIPAPADCLQWYPEATGTLTSFNYQYATTPIVQHLAYQDYTICIRTNQVSSCHLLCVHSILKLFFLFKFC